MIMRRVISLFFAVAVGCLSLSAQTTAADWISALNRSLGSRYAWDISVAVDGTMLSGYYMVEGDSYYMRLGVMEVYSDGKVRYEINNDRCEVTEDRVNLKAVDLLTNPTRAFSFVENEYDVTIAEQSISGATLRLVPRDNALGFSQINLTLSKSGGRVVPQKIVYSYDGDSVSIILLERNATGVGLPVWSKDKYSSYDIVSFL